MPDDITMSFETPDGGTLDVVASVSMLHPEQCTFRVNRPVYPDRSAHFASAERSMGSPLVDALFALGPVSEVLVNHDVVRVTIQGEAQWDDLVPRVGRAIRDALVAGADPIAPAVARAQLPDDELRRRVQNVLDSVINPAVAAHGGVVNLLDVSNNTVYLEFGGGCQGCGMINVTLKYGVERAIRDEVPEVGEILDTTDHAAGRNPYYAPSAK